MKKIFIWLSLVLVTSILFSTASFASSAKGTEKSEETEDVKEETEKETKDSDEKYDFKKFHWGDKEEDIIAIEGEPDIKDKMLQYDAYYLAYEDVSVAGKEAILAYYFSDDEGLFTTKYILTTRHSNENLYIDDYNDIVDALTKKYGSPDINTDIWSDNSKKDYYSSRKGDALSYGYLTYYTLWTELPKTSIVMIMSADNYEVSTSIEFGSKDISVGEADFSDDF